jgi:two-component system, response regulator PdtaR
MNGYELARHVHQLRPEVEILISSGREWPGENDLPPGAAFLPKPYPNAKLVSRVQAAALKAQEARRLRQAHQDNQAAGNVAESISKTA